MTEHVTYRISLDPADVDCTATHAFLTRSYWAAGISLETVHRSIANSICASAHDDAGQVGFARVITDRATFAYLADVYTLEEHRGHGIAASMVSALQNHPHLQGLRRWMLATKDAHALYAKLGWSDVPDPSIIMQRHDPDAYQ